MVLELLFRVDEVLIYLRFNNFSNNVIVFFILLFVFVKVDGSRRCFLRTIINFLNYWNSILTSFFNIFRNDLWEVDDLLFLLVWGFWLFVYHLIRSLLQWFELLNSIVLLLHLEIFLLRELDLFIFDLGFKVGHFKVHAASHLLFQFFEFLGSPCNILTLHFHVGVNRNKLVDLEAGLDKLLNIFEAIL